MEAELKDLAEYSQKLEDVFYAELEFVMEAAKTLADYNFYLIYLKA